MRTLLTFFGGVAVGILAVTGVYAMDENEPKSFDQDETELDRLDDEDEEGEKKEEETLIVQGS